MIFYGSSSKGLSPLVGGTVFCLQLPVGCLGCKVIVGGCCDLPMIHGARSGVMGSHRVDWVIGIKV